MAKKKEVPNELNQQNAEDAMNILGYREMSLPADANIDKQDADATETQELQQPEKVVNEDTSSETTEEEAVEAETQEENDEAEEPDQNEQQRRSWQSERDQFKNKADELAAQNQQLQAQNEALLKIMAGQSQSNSQSAQPQTPKQMSKKPELSDFIDPSQYDPMDAADLTKESGRAYAKWQEAMMDYKFESQLRNHNQQTAAQQKQAAIMESAEKIAQEFPEYRNVFGKPDLEKINRDLNKLGDPNNWVNLFKLARSGGKPSKSQPTLNGVGMRSSKPSSVSKSTTTSESEKKESDTVKNLRAIYGNQFDLPGNIS